MKWVALLIFGGLGAGVFVGGLLWGLRRYPLFHDGRQTTGKIVALEVPGPEADPEKPNRTDTSVLPVVEFETSGGQRVRFTGSAGGSGHPEYEVGGVVEVVYDPANPRIALIGNSTQVWLQPALISLFGAIFLAMGIAAFFLIRNSDRALGLGTFGPKFQKRVDRDLLLFQPDALHIRGQVTDLRPNPADGGKTSILTCTGRVAEDAPERRFHSDAIPAERAGSLVGRPVTVIIDPVDRSRYLVELGPLLSEPVMPERGP
jgi:hypothetical protein